MKGERYTPEEKEVIRQMIRSGVKPNYIAYKTGVGETTIYLLRREILGESISKRHWTKEEDKILFDMWHSLHSSKEIAEALNRPVGSVASRIHYHKMRGNAFASRKLNPLRQDKHDNNY